MRVPDTIFTFRDKEKATFIKSGNYGCFDGKRVVVFSLPGAFTPTCSNYQLPAYDDRYQEFKDLGIDEVYCISVNDGFVMNAWAEYLGVENVKLLPDGNGDFTYAMGMSVSKQTLDSVSDPGVMLWLSTTAKSSKCLKKPGKVGNCPDDPYTVSDPETVLNYLKTYGGKNDE